MNSETRNCQNCKGSFQIEADDFSFYEKIKVPPPTFCPECRMRRRLSWRNERTWHKRVCNKTGKSIISTFSSNSPYIVYDLGYWKSDDFDSTIYGKDYDFSVDFFTQFDSLLKTVPHPNLIQKNNINCEYSNYSIDCKNCYVVASAVSLEDCAYCLGSVTTAKNCFDIHQSNDVESCYELVDCMKSYKLYNSQNCEACSESSFLYDCKNSANCVGCVGLRNASYCIFNEQYTKELWHLEVSKLQLNTRDGREKVEKKMKEIKKNFPKKYALINKAENCTGDDIINARNCHFCFYARNNVENVKYSFKTFKNVKDGYDGVTIWDNAELFCECVSISAQRTYFSQLIWGGYDIEYSFNCFDCNNIFGCVGLRNKSYCIFNKEYTKEEYSDLVGKIKQQMREIPYINKKGHKYTYGEFLPSEFSPYGYNDSLAYEFFPMNKDEVLSCGFQWQEQEQKNHKPTIQAEDLSATNDISETITNEVIGCIDKGTCSHGCSSAFRITTTELDFYRKHSIPLPQWCPGCRHSKRVARKNPMRLWHRQCMCQINTHNHEGVCVNEFETPYSPDRPEKVYCESCYNKEIL